MTLISSFVAGGDGTQLHVRHTAVQVTEPVCVLIHGAGDASYVWEYAFDSLNELCPFVTVDLRGHGDSEPGRKGRYDFRLHVEDVKNVVQALSLQRIILVGHSLGGQVALSLASDHLFDRMVGLMLIDICAHPNQECMQRVVQMLRESQAAYRSPRAYIESLLNSRPFLSEATAVSIARNALRAIDEGYRVKLDPSFVWRECADEDPFDLQRWERLCSGVHCPVLLVRGQGSAMVSAAAATTMMTLLPRAGLSVIPSAGHAVMTDNPEAFRWTLLRFVRRLLSTEARKSA